MYTSIKASGKLKLQNYKHCLCRFTTAFVNFYHKVVWAETEYVGCAVAFCNPLDGFTHPSAYHYVCNYGERWARALFKELSFACTQVG